MIKTGLKNRADEVVRVVGGATPLRSAHNYREAVEFLSMESLHSFAANVILTSESIRKLEQTIATSLDPTKTVVIFPQIWNKYSTIISTRIRLC